LILAAQPRAPHRPDGGAQVVLTAYGLTESAFDTVRNGWTRWSASAMA